MTHLIQRKICHLEFNGSEQEALELQTCIAELCKHHLPRELEKVFDRVASQDEYQYYRFPHLEIDLGTIALDQIESNFVETTVQVLENCLKEQIKQQKNNSKTLATPADQPNHEPWSILLYFLKTGSLPWGFRLPQSCNLEQYLQNALKTNDTSTKKQYRSEAFKLGNAPDHPSRPQAVMTELSASFMAELSKLLIHFEPARKRLIWNFSADFASSILALLTPERYSLWKNAVEKIHHSRVFSSLNWDQILLESLYLQRSGNEAELIARAITLKLKTTSLNAAELTAIKKIWRQNNFPKELLAPFISKEVEPPVPSKNPNPNPDQASTTLARPNQTDPLIVAQPASIKVEEPLEKLPSANLPHSAFVEGLYVENAGLVILHPFLATFFESVGVAKEGKLTQPERALALLQHLATGQTTAAEYELILPKLLCNLPLDEPFDLRISLSETEMAEAKTLLSTVIQYWTALSNSQVDELRGNFLCRFGKLSRKEEGDWLLQIERQSYDILLDQLPWGIGLVKLPWMDEMLWVEW